MNETPITQETANQLYREYLKSITPDEEALMDLIYENEQNFAEMCLQADSIVHDFVVYELENDDGEFEEMCDDHGRDLESLKWRFYVKNFNDDKICGQTYLNERKIVINERYKDDLPTILHEMIHAYEPSWKEIPSFYRDAVLLCLYEDLSSKIPDLHDRIVRHSHEYFGWQITLSGGEHDILFFLKSLDLDLKYGYKLGTVCGYGRDEFDDTEGA